VTLITGSELSSKPVELRSTGQPMAAVPTLGLSLHAFRIWIRGLIAQALQHGQAGILGEPGVCGRELAHIEGGPAVGMDFTHVQATATQAYLREVATFMLGIEVAHQDRITRSSSVEFRSTEQPHRLSVRQSALPTLVYW
jgi:hypothetical protein